MKNVFSLNMTDENNSQFDGNFFAVKTVSEELIQKNNSTVEEYENLEKQLKPPAWFSVVKYALLILGVVFVAGIIKGISGEGSLIENFKNGFMNAPYIFVLCPIFIAGFFIISFIERQKFKVITESEELTALEEQSDELARQIEEELGIPEDALKVDILCYAYKIDKKGNERKYSDYATHVPMEMFMFADGENMYIANYNSLFVFPLSQIACIKEREDKIKLLCWNKEEEINEGEFAKYKMSVDNFGVILANGFATVVINSDFGETGIDLPLYELDKVKTLLNM